MPDWQWPPKGEGEWGNWQQPVPGPPPQPSQSYPQQPPPPPYAYPYPYPYAPPPTPPPQRGPGVLTIAFGVVGGLVLTVALCCTGGAVLSGLGAASRGTTTPTPQAPARVGQTLTTDDIACTLVSVQGLAGDEFIQPKAGNTFVVVRVKIVNQSDSSFAYNDFEFRVTSSAGNVTSPEIPPSSYTANRLLDSGQLTTGGSVTGDIVFQVPAQDHGATLSWEPSLFSSLADNVWSLGL